MVDDSPLMRRLLASALSEAGFDVVAVAAGGAEALEACAKHRPDVLSLDLAMPGLHGLDVLRALNQTGSKTRVVVVSAFSPAEFTDAGGFHAANTAFQRADADPTSGPYNGSAGNWPFDMVTISGTVVPEPSTALLIACGFGLVAAAQRRRNL